MSLKDLKVGVQLRIGLGIIMLLVLIIGYLSWSESDELWMDTKELYDHPFQVEKSVGNIKINIIYMHREMKDLFLSMMIPKDNQYIRL